MAQAAVNLSFSFRTPSTSWYLLVGVKKTRYDKRFLGREDNKTKITTNRGNENSLSLFSSSFVSMSKEKMMKEEKGRERHRLENIAKDRKVIPESPVSQRTLKEKIKPWEKREKYAWKQWSLDVQREISPTSFSFFLLLMSLFPMLLSLEGHHRLDHESTVRPLEADFFLTFRILSTILSLSRQWNRVKEFFSLFSSDSSQQRI